MINRKFILLTLTAVLFVTTACSGGEVRRSLGLERNSPDEFLVISKPPLSVPPDFSLEPPTDYAKAQSSNVSDQAKDVLFPESAATTDYDNVTQGESALLNQAGTSEADPQIREILAKEVLEKQVYEEEKGILDSITDTFKPEQKDPILDVDKEEERIAENIKEGKPVNEGEVSEKGTEKKGILNNLLGL